MFKFFKKPMIRTQVNVPLTDGPGKMITFKNLDDSNEHIAISFGEAKVSEAPLVRIHSECLTGDVFGSEKCDCGDQLQEAIRRLREENGILLYLRQEGRGIGLYNKLDAYALQATGLDTYESNQQLGFANDLRSYKVAAEMLRSMGVSEIRLLTNNPDKCGQVEEFGIKVRERVSTGVFVKKANFGYLFAKVAKTSHRLDLQLGKV